MIKISKTNPGLSSINTPKTTNSFGRLQSDWPFPAAKMPIFYGWIIALVSTLGFLFSVPGQTMGMAVFADTFII